MDREELAPLQAKKYYKSELELEDQDVIIVMSDGVPHAGIGKSRSTLAGTEMIS